MTMNELPTVEQPKETSSRPMDRRVFDQMMRQKFAYSLKEYGSPQAAIENMLGIPENQVVMEATGQSGIIRDQLLACAAITDKDAFAEAVFQAMRPVIDRLYADQGTLSQADTKRVYVNEMLNYDIQGDSLRIHIFTGGTGDVRRYLEGLSMVAQAVSENPNIKTIDAISWIVLKDKRVTERILGFTIQKDADGKPIVVETIEGQDYGHASMTREDFLSKYLKQ